VSGLVSRCWVRLGVGGVSVVRVLVWRRFWLRGFRSWMVLAG